MKLLKVFQILLNKCILCWCGAKAGNCECGFSRFGGCGCRIGTGRTINITIASGQSLLIYPVIYFIPTVTTGGQEQGENKQQGGKRSNALSHDKPPEIAQRRATLFQVNMSQKRLVIPGVAKYSRTVTGTSHLSNVPF